MAEAARLAVDGSRVRVEGALDHRGVTALAAASAGLFAGRDALEVDLGPAAGGNSAGVALLLDWTRQARAAGCRLTLHNLPPSLEAIVAVSGVAQLLPIAAQGGT